MPGSYLKQVRERLGLTIRQVKQLSDKIAQAKKNRQYFVSNSWLTKLEKGRSTPTVYALFSLSVIYRIAFDELLADYDVNLDAISAYTQMIKLPYTHLIAKDITDSRNSPPTINLIGDKSAFRETALLSSIIKQTGEVPIEMFRHLDTGHSTYGYIGLEDFMLYPLLRPGSIVLIDERQNKVLTEGWHHEFDRPIYFLELRDGFACSWCEVEGNQITLLPHPMSPSQSRHLPYPKEATIVGRVTGVAMHLDARSGPGPPPEQDSQKKTKRQRRH